MPENLINPTVNIPRHNKPPRSILPRIFAFAPNRDSLGGTAYFIVNQAGNLLIDCPAWQDSNLGWLQENGGVRWLIFTHRGGMGKQVQPMQEVLQCEVIVQEQEAYLLPEIKVTSFASSFSLIPEIELIWTPGHSPGSTCVYYSQQGGVLFTGRHLLPKSAQEIVPLRTAKTFHWWRQIKSVANLRDRFLGDNLQYILPGANTGYLRGQGYIDDANRKLQSLDLDDLKNLPLCN
ncbi:MAG: MBL fold metallo-hydrolase [Xenococcus sp. MO_188.B8]|nr:MBL fold metallo-hydrolase [Xenococcus sp. MO_188.B8]